MSRSGGQSVGAPWGSGMGVGQILAVLDVSVCKDCWGGREDLRQLPPTPVV